MIPKLLFLPALGLSLLLGTTPSFAVTIKSFIGYKSTGFVPGSTPGSTIATLCAYTVNPPTPTVAFNFLPANLGNVISPPACLITSSPVPGLIVTDPATILTTALKPLITKGQLPVGGSVRSITTSTSPAGGSTTSTAKAYWSSSWPITEKIPQSNLTAAVDVVKTGSFPRLGAASALSDDPYLELTAGTYPFNITFEIDPTLSSLDPITTSNPLELLNESTEDITFVSAEGLIGPQGLEPNLPIWRFTLGIYPDKSIFVGFFSDPAYIKLINPTSDSTVMDSLLNSLDRSVAGSVKLNKSPYQLFAAELTSFQNFSYSEKASAYSVPSPFPLAGVALAFRFSRRLRARVRIRDGCKHFNSLSSTGASESSK